MTHTTRQLSNDDCDSLFALALHGDAAAAERLYAGCVPALAGWLAQRISPLAAREAAHEAMAEAFRRGGYLQAGGSFRGWLRSIAWHRALNTLRNETRRKAREHVYFLQAVPFPVAGLHERHRRLAGLLAGLPASQRELLELHYVHGKSSRVIAELQGRTRSAVAVSLHRLCRRLRTQMLSQPGSGCPIAGTAFRTAPDAPA